jgi:hypothetical protein
MDGTNCESLWILSRRLIDPRTYCTVKCALCAVLCTLYCIALWVVGLRVVGRNGEWETSLLHGASPTCIITVSYCTETNDSCRPLHPPYNADHQLTCYFSCSRAARRSEVCSWLKEPRKKSKAATVVKFQSKYNHGSRSTSPSASAASLHEGNGALAIERFTHVRSTQWILSGHTPVESISHIVFFLSVVAACTTTS